MGGCSALIDLMSGSGVNPRMHTRPLLIALVVSMLPALASAQNGRADGPALKKMIAKYAPVDLTADLSRLDDKEQRALVKIIQAAKIMDGLFMRQTWSNNLTTLAELSADATPVGKDRLRYFLINKGPWSRLNEMTAFVSGVGDAPKAGTFYPPDATKDELEAYFKSLGEQDRRHATGFFTTIRRMPNGKLTYVPYSVEYQAELGEAARYLREAAELTQQATLKKFLLARADAFLSGNYYPSDVAWMELDASIEPTIGPYEVYEDHWFNFKAAFEAFITLRDEGETAKLEKFSGQLQELENTLPIDAKLRNPKLGAMAPIRVVNSIFSSGDANRGVQTAAFNLPNDERVAKEKGTKRVMLRNVQDAKFQKVLIPITKVVLAPPDRKNVQFDAFFTHILMHELMHGLGPGSITVNGKPGTVREYLKDTYSALEEAKADISGLWAMQQLIDKGVIDASMQNAMYTTFVASAFRTLRFGIGEAHGKGMAIQLNHLLDAGAVKARPNGTFAIDVALMKEAATALTTKIMMIQATGDYAGAQALIQNGAVIRPEIQKALDKLARVPTDIVPRFVTANKLLQQYSR
jgi:hypothetical protein